MSQLATKARPISYAEAVNMLTDKDVCRDVDDACAKLSQAMALLMQRFNAVAKQMHTIDLQRLTKPLKPGWESICKEYQEVACLYRANAGTISGRLKLFCTAVLPVAARVADPRSRRSHEEVTQVLQSFMAITAEHAMHTRSLLKRTIMLIRTMVAFHSELAELVGRQASSGRKEMQDLSVKVDELEMQVRHVCSLNAELTQVGAVHSVYAIFRTVSLFGEKPTKSKIPGQRLALTDDLAKVSKAFESLDTKRNEFAHAEYCAQVRSAQSEFLSRVQTTVSPLISDALLYLESSLTLFLAIWVRLRTDCCEIGHWINHPNFEAPVVSACQQSGKTLYVSLAQCLDVYIAGLDAVVVA
ncbi:hypothetical protein FA15DRAFT_664113 [Coprinopsis marcescibilis]|uniref:Uncharacterized protein n=1 Tax=Coprinopsis marcescibilis TaxID=230819 RepID=A0A5C3LA68_COPMA|nr:hypothetical protein FA15DRAFT_664113 [Coprinopsis marcescibilis]